MSDPYAGIGAADPYDGIGAEADGPDERPTSHSLGFMRGLYPAFSKAARMGTPVDMAADALGLDFLDSRPQSSAAADRAREYLSEREETERPSLAGRIAGEVVSTLPLARLGPVSGGAAAGAMTSEADTVQGLATDSVLGAIGGKVADGVVRKIADVAAPAIEPAVHRLAKLGVRMTPGQIRGGKAMVREDKRMSLPQVGERIAQERARSITDANRAFVDQVLEPLGQRVPQAMEAGHEAVDFAHKAVSDAYEKVVPNLRAQIDPRFVAGMRRLSRDLSTLPEAQQAQFQSVLKAVRFGPNGALGGKALQNALSEVSRLQKTYGTSAVASERELGKVLGGFRDELSDLVMRHNPADAPKLRIANDAFRRLAIVENAASKADDGIASTAQMRQAVRQADPSRRKADTARGKAPMQTFVRDARKVLPSQTPNSFTADRLNAGKMIPELRGRASNAKHSLDAAFTKILADLPPETVQRARKGLLALTAPSRAVGAVLLPSLLDQ